MEICQAARYMRGVLLAVIGVLAILLLGGTPASASVTSISTSSPLLTSSIVAQNDNKDEGGDNQTGKLIGYTTGAILLLGVLFGLSRLWLRIRKGSRKQQWRQDDRGDHDGRENPSSTPYQQ
jgi:hypothetical protein